MQITAAVIEGPDLGLAFALPSRPVVLGKGEAADVRLSDSAVSGRHLELRLEQGEVVATDLNSTNGSFIGTMRLTSGPLSFGSVIKIGRTRLLIRHSPVLVEKATVGTESLGSGDQNSLRSTPSFSYKEARAECLGDFERSFLRAALERAGGNLSRTAEEVGLTRHYLRKLLRNHKIIQPRPPGRPPTKRPQE